MRLIPSELLALVLLTPPCVADSVQGDWVFPQTPDYSSILQLGREYKIQWVPGLASWFQYYCADCDTTAVDLWATGSSNFNHEHKIACELSTTPNKSLDIRILTARSASVNVNSTLSVNWTATFPASELSDSPTWVLRFVSKGMDPASTTEQISSSIFVINDPDSASSSSSSSSSSSAPFSSSSTSSTPPASTSPTMTASAVTGTETTTPPQSNSELSTGAKAGIGVGSAVGAIALFTLGWILARRYGSKGDAPASGGTGVHAKTPQEMHGTALSTDVHELGDPNPGIEMSAH
ncbi:hypothetical protein F4678DRAFT_195243 [Xylaria arbuscula]|nr:hypothetical protein F4678DRAFT_195243 [Xylaria arbuscula]